MERNKGYFLLAMPYTKKLPPNINSEEYQQVGITNTTTANNKQIATRRSQGFLRWVLNNAITSPRYPKKKGVA